MVPHSSGINFLKIEHKTLKKDILKVSKDQNLLLQFIKNIFDGITKETDHFSETYENDFREIISNDVAICFAQNVLCTMIDVFTAYYTNEQVVKEIYVIQDEEKQFSEADILDILEGITTVTQLLILITAYGEGNAKEATDKEGKLVSSADHFKIMFANLDDCLVLVKCGDLM